jgi:hypothetical protein
MFATILRRWHLVTPLALAVLSIMVVSSGLMSQASAHQIAFHFWGDAYALNDLTDVLPDTACDTGFLPLHGGNLDSGHCFAAGGPGEPGAGITGSTRLAALFAESTVVTTHGVVSGNVTATADIEGEGAASKRPLAPDLSPASTCAAAAATFTPANALNFNPDCALVEILATEDRGGGSDGLNGVEFDAEDLREIAVASCHRHSDGSTQATVDASWPFANNVNYVVRENDFLRYIGPNGAPNETFTISGFTDYSRGIQLDILVIINEQKLFVDGDMGAVAANAIHLVGTDADGLVRFNFVMAHVFAGIHCAKHLGTDQNVGTLVDD